MIEDTEARQPVTDQDTCELVRRAELMEAAVDLKKKVATKKVFSSEEAKRNPVQKTKERGIPPPDRVTGQCEGGGIAASYLNVSKLTSNCVEFEHTAILFALPESSMGSAEGVSTGVQLKEEPTMKSVRTLD
ncbi:unnamed protein product [Strongylus vulgaris]|nr:unnamed protein product [Strongylus vulgaris]